MWEAQLLSICLEILIFAALVWVVSQYIRARRLVVYNLERVAAIQRIMQMDEVIDKLLQTEAAAASCQESAGQETASSRATDVAASMSPPPGQQVGAHRERLAALAAGGQARQYLGKALTADQIDTLDEDEVEKLYARYEARLGAAMTKTLGQAALQVYSGVVSMFLPIPPENQPALVRDLEDDPFVGHALSSATCELYHRYGMCLAPLTAALTTVKYCQFGHQCPRTINDGGEPDQSSWSAPGEPATDGGASGKSNRPGGGDTEP